MSHIVSGVIAAGLSMSDRQSDSVDVTPSRHQPVMVREVLRYLDLSPGMTVVDGTVGGGGHSSRILEQIGPSGILVGLDRDSMMLRKAGLKVSGPNVQLRQSSYADAGDVLEELGIDQVDRVLVDLGLSSDQLNDNARGFGFSAEGTLDLRFDTTRGAPAYELVNSATPDELHRILRDHGEERYTDAIVAAIIRQRSRQPIQAARELTDLVTNAIPGSAGRQSRRNPATRVFQALRIAVNGELEQLDRALETGFPDVVRPGGRLVAISFHSLEDRLVKQALRRSEQWENLTSKPVEPAPAECRVNPRSRSAKLRAGVRK